MTRVEESYVEALTRPAVAQVSAQDAAKRAYILSGARLNAVHGAGMCLASDAAQGVNPSMASMNLLVVERNADWSQWDMISRTLNATVLMLVQQPDESSAVFHDRIRHRLARVDRRAIEQVVLLREDGADVTRDVDQSPLFEQLGASARRGLRVYPCAVTA